MTADACVARLFGGKQRVSQSKEPAQRQRIISALIDHWRRTKDDCQTAISPKGKLTGILDRPGDEPLARSARAQRSAAQHKAGAGKSSKRPSIKIPKT